MISLGIAVGVLSAVLQAWSYVCSTWFLQKKHTPFELLLYS